MKIAILFDNCGPYHLARLQAVARVCDLLAVQVYGRSREYDWEPSSPPFNCQSVTLSQQQVRSWPGVHHLHHRLRRELAAFGPDCVFVPGWSRLYSLASLWWCRSNRIPAVLMSESTEHDLPRSIWKERLKRRLVSFFSAGLVGGSTHTKYLVKLGMSPDRIFPGYDVVDNEFFLKSTSAVRENCMPLRRSYGLPERYFLASARFVPKKNLCGLVSAYARYRGRFHGLLASSKRINGEQPWSLVLLGDGPQRNAIGQLISEHGLDSFVLLPGFKQERELPVYYGLASAFVHASTSEPWGLVVNEAMASGLPVLVSNCCGCAPELVCEGRNGFTFAPTNTEQLARLMQRVSTCGPLLPGMADASLRQIADWGPSRFADGFMSAATKGVEVARQRLGGRAGWSTRFSKNEHSFTR